MGNFAELFGPNEQYPYFEKAQNHPFEPHAVGFSVVNAAWLADLALLVYLHDERLVSEQLARAGMTGKCVGFRGSGAKAIVARAEEWVAVSFRGTEVKEKNDVVADARVALLSRPPHAGKIHIGFYDGLGTIWDEIEAELARISNDRGEPPSVWFTGHSLGASMATLAGDRYEGARAVYTLGSPRVGNSAFTDGMTVPAYRIVNNNDVIATMPPGAPASPYRHVGDFVYLDEKGSMMVEPGRRNQFESSVRGHADAAEDTLRDFFGGKFDAVNFDPLRDHSPAAYAEALWRNIEG